MCWCCGMPLRCRSSVAHWVSTVVAVRIAFRTWQTASHCTWCPHDVLPYTEPIAPLWKNWNYTERRRVLMRMCRMSASLCTTLWRRSFTPLTRPSRRVSPNLISTRQISLPPRYDALLWHGRSTTLSDVPRSMAGHWHSPRTPSPMPPTHYSYSPIMFDINRYSRTWPIFMHWRIAWTVTPTRCCRSYFSSPRIRWMSLCGC